MDQRINRRQVLLSTGLFLTGMPRLTLTHASSTSEPKFSVRTPLEGKTLRERVLLANQVGFDGIEIGGGKWFNPPVDTILQDLAGTNMKISAASASQNHLHIDPIKRAESIEENKKRLVKAQKLGADCLVVVPVFGKNKFQDISPIMTPRDIEKRLLVHALRELAPVAEATKVTIVIEPLTKKETHFINRQMQAVEIIRQVDSSGIRLLTDFYHMQMEENDIAQTMKQCAEFTAYVHVADGEKRLEPGSLPFDYRPGFAELKKIGYSGWITIEAGSSSKNIKHALKNGLAYLKQQWKEA
jgi:sugar phosphate isomerase/epimerase